MSILGTSYDLGKPPFWILCFLLLSSWNSSRTRLECENQRLKNYLESRISSNWTEKLGHFYGQLYSFTWPVTNSISHTMEWIWSFDQFYPLELPTRPVGPFPGFFKVGISSPSSMEGIQGLNIPLTNSQRKISYGITRHSGCTNVTGLPHFFIWSSVYRKSTSKIRETIFQKWNSTFGPTAPEPRSYTVEKPSNTVIENKIQ